MSKEAIEDRRERAREAFWDAVVNVGAREAAEEAIETATRVKITDEALVAFKANAGLYERGLRAFLAELGFEVEE